MFILPWSRTNLPIAKVTLLFFIQNITMLIGLGIYKEPESTKRWDPGIQDPEEGFRK
jgi:hypothetical protein